MRKLIKYLKIGLAIFNCIQCKNVYAQIVKPTIDSAAIAEWPSLDGIPLLTNDGKFVLYKIQYRYNSRENTYIIQSLTSDWFKKFTGLKQYIFTSNSQRAIILNSNDSICIIGLANTKVDYIANVTSFNLCKSYGEELLYCYCRVKKTLEIRNLGNGKDTVFVGVNNYWLSPHGKYLILNLDANKLSSYKQSILYLNLFNLNSKIIWSGALADDFIFSTDDSQFAFRSSSEQSSCSFWYFKDELKQAAELMPNGLLGNDSCLVLSDLIEFSSDNSKIWFNVEKRENLLQRDSNLVSVDIWSYADPILQSEQLNELGKKKYRCYINLGDRNIVRHQMEGDFDPEVNYSGSRDFIDLVESTKGSSSETNWSIAARPSIRIISRRDGGSYPLNLVNLYVSPDEKYVLGSNKDRDLVCYSMNTHKYHNISASIPVPKFSDEHDLHFSKGIKFIAWLFGNREILVRDKFDIWKVDLLALNAPVNITNGFGRNNKVEFKVAKVSLVGNSDGPTIAVKKIIILQAFSFIDKEQGYYLSNLETIGNPTKLYMGPIAFDNYDFPIKARDTDVYLVKFGSASQSPNLFWTKNFRSFSSISQLAPEANYKWLRTKVVRFKTLDNVNVQGTFYLPEDLDTGKKYPTIVTYYESRSNETNKFIYHDDGYNFNITWFVSRGYIVFIPDIYFRIGKAGRCALNSIVGAAKYLHTINWVDKSHIGIIGHSFGGFETNYVIAHSNCFAAAISSSGVSDAISNYGSLWATGHSKQEFYETGQGKIGTTLWRRPDLYIDNSPVLRADKICTPLLIVSNKKDGNVPFDQGLQLFLALRRLGKNAWMLQYDNATHGEDGAEFFDYTLRSQQFFDFYLKHDRAPVWMVEGVSAEMKGKISGLQLEPAGVIPKPGLLIN